MFVTLILQLSYKGGFSITFQIRNYETTKSTKNEINFVCQIRSTLCFEF